MKRRAMIACAAVVLVTAALVAWKGWYNAQEAARAEAEEQVAAEGTEGSAAKPPKVEIDGEHAALVDAYTPDMEFVAEILEGNLWESGTGAVAEFGRGSVSERLGDKEKSSPFAIAAIEHTVEGDGAGGSIDVWRGSALMDGSEALFTLSQAHGKDTGDLPWAVSCSGFALDTEYQLAKRSEGIELPDLSAAHAVIGGERGTKKVAAALEEHAAKAAPTATKATWDGRASVNFEQGSTELSFTFDDSRETTVRLAVSIDGGNVTFGD